MTQQTTSHQQNLIQQSQGRMGRPDYLGSQRNSCWHLDSCFISGATNPEKIWGTFQLVVGRRLLTEEAAQLVLARTANNTQSIRFVTASLFQGGNICHNNVFLPHRAWSPLLAFASFLPGVEKLRWTNTTHSLRMTTVYKWRLSNYRWIYIFVSILCLLFGGWYSILTI